MVTAASLLQRIRHGDLSAVLGGNAGLLLVGVFTSVVAARGLGPEERGIFFAVQGTGAVLGVLCSLGVPQVLVVAKAGSGDLWRGMLPPVALGFLGGAVLALTLSVSQGRDPDVFLTLGGALFVGASVIGAFGPALAQRTHQMKGAFQTLRIVPTLAMLVAMVILWAAGQGSGALWLLVCGAVVLTANVVGVFWYYGRDLVHGERHGALGASFWRAAVGSLGIAACSQVMYRGDILVLAYLGTAHQIGVYAVALAIGGAVASLGRASGMRMFPKVSSAIERRDELPSILRAAAREAIVVSAAVAVLAMLAIFWAVPLLYGEEFQGAVLPAYLLALAAVPMSVDYLFTHVGFAMGCRRQVLVAQCVVIAGFIPALVLLAPRFGLLGVATACVVASTTSATLLVLVVGRSANEKRLLPRG